MEVSNDSLRWNLSYGNGAVASRKLLCLGGVTMIEDNMSDMAEVFLNGGLPFPEYLTESKLHHVSIGLGKAMNDMQRKYGTHFMAKYSVPRPNGKVTELSVISGMMFYSRKGEPYEIMVHEREGNDPLPYQTDEDLMLLIAKLLGEGESNGLPK